MAWKLGMPFASKGSSLAEAMEAAGVDAWQPTLPAIPNLPENLSWSGLGGS